VPGQLAKLLNLVRDPLQVFEDAARANPQRLGARDEGAMKSMARDFAAHVANERFDTGSEVEHFTYRPLGRLPDADVPYNPLYESRTDNHPSQVAAMPEFWEAARNYQPTLSIHNHPSGAVWASTPDLVGLAYTQPASIGTILGGPRADQSFQHASAYTNLGMPDWKTLQDSYRRVQTEFPVEALRKATGLPFDNEGETARTLRDLKTLDLVDQGQLRVDATEQPATVAAAFPLFKELVGRQHAQTVPADLAGHLDWHAAVLDRLRRSGFAVPAAAATPSVLDQLRAPDQGEGQ